MLWQKFFRTSKQDDKMISFSEKKKWGVSCTLNTKTISILTEQTMKLV